MNRKTVKVIANSLWTDNTPDKSAATFSSWQADNQPLIQLFNTWVLILFLKQKRLNQNKTKHEATTTFNYVNYEFLEHKDDRKLITVLECLQGYAHNIMDIMTVHIG